MIKEYIIEFIWRFANNYGDIKTAREVVYADSLSQAYYIIRISYPGVKIKMKTKEGRVFWS